MSDIQELIHKTSMDCMNKGKTDERKAIVKHLDQLIEVNRLKLRKTTGETTAVRLMGTIIGLEDAIKLIKSLD
jgi:hypothetical protein